MGGTGGVCVMECVALLASLHVVYCAAACDVAAHASHVRATTQSPPFSPPRPSEYKVKVKMPSKEFKSVTNDLAVLGDTCTIGVNKEGIKFSVSGDLGAWRGWCGLLTRAQPTPCSPPSPPSPLQRRHGQRHAQAKHVAREARGAHVRGDRGGPRDGVWAPQVALVCEWGTADPFPPTHTLYRSSRSRCSTWGTSRRHRRSLPL